MNSNYLKTFDSIYNNQLINRLIDSFMSKEFITSWDSNNINNDISLAEIRKGIWLVSILASSSNEEHVKKAQLFAALIYLNNPENIDITRASYVIFSRTGNLIATKFFTELFTDIKSNVKDQQMQYDFDLSLDLEISNDRNESIINIKDESYIATRFQKNLWDELNTKNNISISAPTSSGKSFIVKKYIKKRFQESESLKILYIVPSRALINQVSEEFSIDLENINVDVRTAFIIDIEKGLGLDKQIFILTPERCLRLLQYIWNSNFRIDLIFVDEIQNVEEQNGRGTLLESVLRELSLLKSKAQIVSAGPNIDNPEGLFYRIFGIESKRVQTTVSPVFQIKAIIRPRSNSLDISIKTHENQTVNFSLQTNVNLKSKFSQSIGRGLLEIINLLGGKGQSIIYCPKTDLAENWSLKFTESNSDKVIDERITDLVEFLEEEIHPKYYLIPCLKSGVAFHHGKLPDIVRKEIEDLFSIGIIRNLFCTSTLLEGVNLPANNLFIVLPQKRTENLSQFEFGNLIGRAGRIKDTLYGTVYCIERDDEELWAEKYYEKSFNKQVITVSERSLGSISEFEQKLRLTDSNLFDNGDLNTIVFLKHKILREERELHAYLSLKKVNSDSVSYILDMLKETLKDISIPSEILRLNPSIDPVLQDNLYKAIIKDGIENWAITPNSNFFKKMTRSTSASYSFSNLNLFWQLVSILEKMDSFFDIQKETFFKHQISVSIAQMCVYGLNWLENKSYKQLIDQDLGFYSRHINPNKKISLDDIDAVNKRINQVIKINTTIVSYVLVKYLKLLTDILGSLMSNDEKEKYKFSLALPLMMELGTTEPVVIKLISKGVPRSISLKIFKEFQKLESHEDIDIMYWLSSQPTIGLKPIYERYLRNLHILQAVL